MDDFLRQLAELLDEWVVEHWLKLIWFPIAAAGLWIWKRWMDRRAWRRRQFMQRVNCSLNYVEENKLKIRTLFEVSLDDILLSNSILKEMMLKAAKKTKVSDAFVALPDNDDQWHALNAALNEIAERFADGVVAADMGLPVAREWYVFGWTCERDKDVRVRKLRLMVVRERLLQEIAGEVIPPLSFEASSHEVRWRTLQQMTRHYLESLEEAGSVLMRVEITRPCPVELFSDAGLELQREEPQNSNED